MKNFRISKYLDGTKANIYSVFIDNSSEDEFEKFLKAYFESYKEEVQHLVSTIELIANKTGVRDGFFKDQGLNSIYRFKNIKNKKTKLRLYCIKWGSSLIIIGNGGLKNVAAWQDDPELSRIIRCLDKIDEYLFQNKISLDEAVENNTIFEIG